MYMMMDYVGMNWKFPILTTACNTPFHPFCPSGNYTFHYTDKHGCVFVCIGGDREEI